MNANYAAALWLADRGFAVFPCAPNQKRPATANGLLDATTDAEKIESWFATSPDLNLAMRTDGLLVVDVDGADNPWLKDQPERLLELSEAPLAVTPRGGRHFIFRAPDGRRFRNTAGKLAPKVDIRGDGGYILVAPSKVDGREYNWLKSIDSDYDKLPTPPAWLVELLDANTSKPTRVDAGQATAGAIVEGGRNATLTSLAGAMRRKGSSEAGILAALLAENRERCRPPLSDSEVATIAGSVAKYAPDAVAAAMVEGVTADYAPPDEVSPNPGITPDKLLHIPGLVDEIIDQMMETAPYPNLALSFSAAMALQGFLASRTVTDGASNGTNIYVVAAASSGAGKNWPRSIARRILQSCGLSGSCGDAVASGEGLEDTMFVKPSFLLQSDEFHFLLAAMKNGRDPRWNGILNVLLRLYTNGADIYDMRIKAGQEGGAINRPALTLSASAIPSQLYDSLSREVMCNGFFARLIIVEAGPRGRGRKPIDRELPKSIIDAAKFWAEFRPGTGGNLTTENPTPHVVGYSPAAEKILSDFQADCDDHYAKAEKKLDEVGMSVWARSAEKAWRLALIYACSIDYRNPHLPTTGATWACDFVTHQTKRMLWMAETNVSESAFHSEVQKMEKVFRDWQAENPGVPILPSKLRRSLRGMESRLYEDVLKTMTQQGRIEISPIPHKGAGRPASGYLAIGL